MRRGGRRVLTADGETGWRGGQRLRGNGGWGGQVVSKPSGQNWDCRVHSFGGERKRKREEWGRGCVD